MCIDVAADMCRCESCGRPSEGKQERRKKGYVSEYFLYLYIH